MERIEEGANINGYQFIESIGSGAFSTVWKVKHVSKPTLMAIKVIPKNSGFSEKRFKREIEFLRENRHPFIVEFFDVFETTFHYFIVMELISNGNLLQLITKVKNLNESSAKKIFSQLISVLDHLHFTSNIIHRDLKLENVLLDDYYNIRLIDFGLSRKFKSKHKAKTRLGSPAYVAPEMILGHHYTCKVDVWSAGIILFAMCCGRFPFVESDPVISMKKSCENEIIYPVFFSDLLIDLLKKMLDKDPEKRCDVHEIMSHPWFDQGQFDSIKELIAINNDSVDRVGKKEEMVYLIATKMNTEENEIKFPKKLLPQIRSEPQLNKKKTKKFFFCFSSVDCTSPSVELGRSKESKRRSTHESKKRKKDK